MQRIRVEHRVPSVVPRVTPIVESREEGIMEPIQINDPNCSMSEPECQIACTLTAQRDYEAMTVALAAADIDTDVVKIIHGSDGADNLVQIYVPHPRLGGEVL